MSELPPRDADMDRAPNSSASGVYDPLANDEPESRPPSAPSIGGERTDGRMEVPKVREPLVTFWTPSKLRDYVVPEGHNMLGDAHLQRAGISVLAGPPGCGKSRAALWLALLGARGEGEWFGLSIRTRFRTLILQAENGLARLHQDFASLAECEDLDDWIRISEPPTLGLNLSNAHFRAELCRIVGEFAPELIVFDPWNSIARDSMEKDFQTALDYVRDVLAASPGKPACLIVHHLRKPKADDRQRGRSLTNLLNGSQLIVSVPRSVFILQPGSDDTEDTRVVFTPAKNNDGPFGERSAWHRGSATFDRCADFSWGDYDGGSAPKRESKVREEHVREVLGDGPEPMRLSEAVKKLMKLAKAGDTVAYEALQTKGGKFSHLLRRIDKHHVALVCDDTG
jgi:AAA domain